MNLLGELFLLGHDLRLEVLFPCNQSERVPGANGVQVARSKPSTTESRGTSPRVLTDLPTYPWAYSQLLWKESRASKEYRKRSFPHHELLGGRVPGGDPESFVWSNIIDINQVTWVREHGFGETVFFPGTAFLSMAIEAAFQTESKYDRKGLGVELQQCKILKALELTDQRPRAEVVTTMRRKTLSSSTTSTSWWTFTILSVLDISTSAVHCNDTIALIKNTELLTRIVHSHEDRLEVQEPLKWYRRFLKIGFIVKPQFQTMSKVLVDRERQLLDASADITFKRGFVGSQTHKSVPQYLAHPITLDAMLQVCLVASTAGMAENLRTWMPVDIGHMKISGAVDSLIAKDSDDPWRVDTSTTLANFSTMTGTTELSSHTAGSLVQMAGLRFVRSGSGSSESSQRDRQVALKTVWKPDAGFFQPNFADQFTAYADGLGPFKDYLGQRDPAFTSASRIAAAVDLLAHHDPNMRILILVPSSGLWKEATLKILQLLKVDETLMRFRTFISAEIHTEQKSVTGLSEARGTSLQPIPAEDIRLAAREGPYDLVVFTDACSDTRHAFRIPLTHPSGLTHHTFNTLARKQV